MAVAVTPTAAPHLKKRCANRVVAIIDRGTFSLGKDGKPERNVLIVREDSVRPAHFIALERLDSNGFETDFEPSATIAAAEQAMPTVTDHAGMTAYERLKTRILEFTSRYAKQTAAAFAKGLFHGGTSPSNMEISGRYLDYGTQTAHRGHGRVRILADGDAAGDNGELEQVLQTVATEFLRRALGPDTEPRLRLIKVEVLNEFRSTYRDALRLEFLKLAGFPEEILTRVRDVNLKAEFADQLIRIARAGAADYMDRFAAPSNPTKYDFHLLMRTLAELRTLEVSELERKIESVVPLLNERKTVTRRYADLKRMALDVAKSDFGLTSVDFFDVVEQNATELNRPRTTAYRWLAISENKAVIETYLRSGDSRVIRSSIDRRISDSLRSAVPLRAFQTHSNNPGELRHERCVDLFLRPAGA